MQYRALATLCQQTSQTGEKLNDTDNYSLCVTYGILCDTQWQNKVSLDGANMSTRYRQGGPDEDKFVCRNVGPVDCS